VLEQLPSRGWPSPAYTANPSLCAPSCAPSAAPAVVAGRVLLALSPRGCIAAPAASGRRGWPRCSARARGTVLLVSGGGAGPAPQPAGAGGPACACPVPGRHCCLHGWSSPVTGREGPSAEAPPARRAPLPAQMQAGARFAPERLLSAGEAGWTQQVFFQQNKRFPPNCSAGKASAGGGGRQESQRL